MNGDVRSMFQVRFVRVALLNISRIHRTRGEKLREKGEMARSRYLQIFRVVHNLRTMHNSFPTTGTFKLWLLANFDVFGDDGNFISRVCVRHRPSTCRHFGEKVIQGTTRNSTAGEVTFVVRAAEQIESTVQLPLSRRILRAFRRGSRNAYARNFIRDHFAVSQRREASHDHQIELQF